MLPKSTKQYLRRLIEIKAVQINTENGFRLAMHDKNPNAPLSPFYFMLRTPENKGGPLQPADVRIIAHELANAAELKGISYDAVSSIPRAGVSFAKAIADEKESLILPQKTFPEESGHAG
ncbi:MAG TPA: hypothetical protein VNM40_00310 [Candidatus Paceibacterota bacterium]|nr:hypothetical protein [Candidatus Paceibacterota bacterium]